MLKRYTPVIAGLVIYVSLLHGIETSNISIHIQEFDVKGQNSVLSNKDKRDAIAFWKAYGGYVKTHNEYVVSRDKGLTSLAYEEYHKTTSLQCMEFSLKNNLNILTHQTKTAVGMSSPLKAITYLVSQACNRTDYLVNLFNYITQVDTNNERRIDALICGIKQLSPFVVEALLKAKTNVTKSPEVMTTVISQCKETEIEMEKSKLLRITCELLNSQADLSGITTPHVDTNECLRCTLIFNRVDDQREEQENLLSSLLPHPSAPSQLLTTPVDQISTPGEEENPDQGK